jgi:hypothetical protein
MKYLFVLFIVLFVSCKEHSTEPAPIPDQVIPQVYYYQYKHIKSVFVLVNTVVDTSYFNNEVGFSYSHNNKSYIYFEIPFEPAILIINKDFFYIHHADSIFEPAVYDKAVHDYLYGEQKQNL